jgi:predicted GH43/DUF377 family glycosyl hydrolase
MFKKISIVFVAICSMILMTNDVRAQKAEKYKLNLHPVDKTSILESPDYYTWGASPIKGKDGKYHIFYSRWKKKYGFLAWVTHSEIAHAVSKNPLGPYKFHDLSMPARGQQYWDGMNTHNPTIHYFDGKYYLYYTGNTGDTKDSKTSLNVSHRNNQRIGVAVAESPNGPWKRFDKPLIDISADSTAYDALMTANPSITRMKDGKYLMVYKAVAKKRPGIWGGPVVHLCAISDKPTGPFIKNPNPIFTSTQSDFPAEDPYVWYQDGYYYAIVKDMKGSFTHAGRSLALFYSENGLTWKPTDNCLLSTPEIHWKDGSVTKLQHLERPQLLIEKGRPTALFLAADSTSDYSKDGTSFNIHISLK